VSIQRFLPKLYEILASMNYNTERIDLLQEVLRIYLKNPVPDFEVATTARKINDGQRKTDLKEKTEALGSNNTLTADFWFQQDDLLSSNIFQEYIPEYVQAKYGPFGKHFVDQFELRIEAPFLLGFKLAEYLEFKKNNAGFQDEVHRFTSKEQYADRGFVSIPPPDYLRMYANVVTINKDELTRIVSGLVSPSEVKKILDIISIDIRLPLTDEKLRFVTHPLLKIDDTLLVLTPRYVTRSIPFVYEGLCRQIKSFNDSKGKAFENLVQDTVKYLPFQSLAFNKIYGSAYDVDAIVEFPNSIWFVEVSSHPPSLRSLQGDTKAIKTDLKKAINKCIFQGRRCFAHEKSEALSPYFRQRNKKKAVLIVLDGVYPQLNPSGMIKFFDENIPVYVINWFDLRHLVDQPELPMFENFLLWRIRRPMPVFGIDEGDYWGFYFDHFVKDPRMREAFSTMQERHIGLTFISGRFSDKRYLEKIAPTKDSR